MGFVETLSKKLSSLMSGEKNDIKAPVLNEYIEWLLAYMVRTSKTEVIVDTKRSIPGSNETGGNVPPFIPTAEAIINKLKILSGFNPVTNSKPIDGGFTQPIGAQSLIVKTRFLDTPAKSTCVIRISIRARR